MSRALHGRSLAQWLVVGALLSASAVGAQSARDPRVGVVGTLGVVGIPDAFGPQCGRNGGGGGSPALEAGATAHVRPWSVLVVSVDVHRVAAQMNVGCTLVLFPVDTAYDGSDRRDPFLVSTMRLGVETPLRFPLVRLSGGVGRVWGEPMRPVTTAGLAVGTRGRVRVSGEVHAYRSRVDAQEVTTTFGVAGVRVRRPIVARPQWYAWRVSIEVPLIR